MFINNSDTNRILEAILELNIKHDEAVFILIAEKDKPDLNNIIEQLNNKSIVFFGGIFPGIIYDSEKYYSGTIITKIPLKEKPLIITELDKDEITIPLIEINQSNDYTVMILIDGLTSNISSFLAKVFETYSNTVNYIGGGAGSLSLVQEPCVFTNEGIFQDAAIISFIPLKSNLGVAHGWERIMGPIVATKTDKNKIIELNWDNAFEMYKSTVENDSGQIFNDSNFFDLAKSYPFGIYKEGMEDIVRDPIATNNKGELICVGEVEENTSLNILKGKDELLIEAAGSAAKNCNANVLNKISHAFVIDCISRVLFLEDSFKNELKVVRSKIPKSTIPIGILSLGEISSYGEGYIEFFNKTTVVGVLHG